MRTPSALHPRLNPLAACLALALPMGSAAAPALCSNHHPPPRMLLRASAPADRHLLDSFAAHRQRIPASHRLSGHAPGAIIVENCNDSGPGSLRDAVTSAVDGDTIDLRDLACSVITLTSGEIVVGVDNLTIEGPGAGHLSISGNNASAILTHPSNAGILTIDGIEVRDGVAALGGCILAYGDAFEFDNSRAENCRATSASGNAIGGAIAAAVLTISDSTITGNAAIAGDLHEALGGGVFGYVATIARSTISNNYTSTSTGMAFGGGIYAGTLAIADSIVGNNAVDSGPSGSAIGGGLWVNTNLEMVRSAVIENQAFQAFGGMLLDGVSLNSAASITDSTISGNTTAGVGGGIGNFGSTELTLANSTVAFNTADTTAYPGGSIYAGVALVGTTAHLQSTIISNNSAAGMPADLSATGGGSVDGANLIVLAANVPLPPDTLFDDPLLGPLQDNGGRTPTDAIGADSPAIDAGNNAAGLEFDQRGEGFPRSIGLTDIGAFEFGADQIFSNGFD